MVVLLFPSDLQSKEQLNFSLQSIYCLLQMIILRTTNQNSRRICGAPFGQCQRRQLSLSMAPSAPPPLAISFDAYPARRPQGDREKEELPEAAGEEMDEQTNPLVIVHGLFGHKQNWRGVARALQKKLSNRVFVLDMRNHGDSPRSPDCTYAAMASDLRHFVETEVFRVSFHKSVFLLGHSMGGKAVAQFAMDKANSNMIEKLIIEDIAPNRSSHSGAAEFGAYIEAMREADLTKNRSEIGQALEASIPDPSIRAFLLTNLYKPRGGPFKWRCDLDALAANLDHLLGHEVIARKGAKCDAWTLFLSGQKSPFMTKADQSSLKAMFPHARFEVIPKAGHWVHSEQPARFIESVTKFIQYGYITYEFENDERN